MPWRYQDRIKILVSEEFVWFYFNIFLVLAILYCAFLFSYFCSFSTLILSVHLRSIFFFIIKSVLTHPVAFLSNKQQKYVANAKSLVSMGWKNTWIISPDNFFFFKCTAGYLNVWGDVLQSRKCRFLAMEKRLDPYKNGHVNWKYLLPKDECSNNRNPEIFHFKSWLL